MTATAAHPRSSATSPYDSLLRQAREASLLGATGQILGWDQETMMPEGGIDLRSRQLAQLARMTHELATDPRVGEWLAACEADRAIMADPHSVAAVNVRELRRSYDRLTKLPASLVEEFAQLTSVAQHEWAEARKKSDFAHFSPYLERIVALLRQKAACFGWDQSKGEAWDALADEYEVGCTAAMVESVFKPLRERLSKLNSDLLGKGKAPKAEFNEFPVAIDAQEQFAKFVTEKLGFDELKMRMVSGATLAPLVITTGASGRVVPPLPAVNLSERIVQPRPSWEVVSP